MLDTNENLESRLAEKEQLVAALTERLEQAAEQLDRLHRTGADRGMRAGIAGIPPELIQQQQKLVDDLQRAVQQWEDLQPGTLFGRIENQLADIREHLHDAGGPGHSSGRSRSSGYAQESHSEPDHSAESPSNVLAFMRAAAYGTPEPAAAASSAPTEPDVATAYLPKPDIVLPVLQDPPDTVDVPEATIEELRVACDERDTYIAYLLKRLKLSESRGHVPHSWTDVENVPGELRLRLESLEKRLQDTLRLSEVELSLQRAKLAREETRIRALDEQTQKEIRRAKHSAPAPGESTDKRPEEGPGSGRWMRMLGRRSHD